MHDKYSEISYSNLMEFHKNLIKDKASNYDVIYSSLKAMIYLANSTADILCLFDFIEAQLKFQIPLKLLHSFYVKLCTLNIKIHDKEPLDFVESQLENETGDESIKVRKACEAALPDAPMKRALILDEYLNPDEWGTASVIEYSMKSLRQKSQEELLKDVDRVIYENIKLIKNLDRRMAILFINYVFPSYHSEMNLWQLSNLEKEITDRRVLEMIEIKKCKISRTHNIKVQCLKYSDLDGS
jgi:hypothetical protein